MQVLNHGSILKKIHRVIKSDFGKDFFKLMNNSVFRRNIENVATCNNRTKKKLFGVRVKLSQDKIFHKNIFSSRNKKNPNMHE